MLKLNDIISQLTLIMIYHVAIINGMKSVDSLN